MKKLFTILFLLCVSYSAKSQDSITKPILYWMDSGIGIYTTFDEASQNRLSIYTGISVKNKLTVFKLRYMRNYELDVFNDLNPAEYFSSFNFLLGRGIYEKGYNLQAAIGIGFTSGVARKKYLGNNGAWIFSQEMYEGESFTRLSIPIEFESVFKITKYVGLGAGLYFEMNFTKPLLGLNGKVILGKLY